MSAQTVYRLVSVEGYKHECVYEQDAPDSNGYRFTRRVCTGGCQVRGIAPWTPPAPIRYIPPPDYSTPAKVSARAREAGTRDNADILAAGNATDFKKLLREFRAIVPRLPAPVVDTHKSRVPPPKRRRTRKRVPA